MPAPSAAKKPSTSTQHAAIVSKLELLDYLGDRVAPLTSPLGSLLPFSSALVQLPTFVSFSSTDLAIKNG